MQNGNERANSRIILKKNTINLGDILNTLKERQVTSRILISIFEKCLDYLQKWLTIDIGLVWYGEDGQFDFSRAEFEVWLYIQVELSRRQLEIQDGELMRFK